MIKEKNNSCIFIQFICLSVSIFFKIGTRNLRFNFATNPTWKPDACYLPSGMSGVAGAAPDASATSSHSPTKAPKDTHEKSIDTCLKLLKGKSDEEKFAGLLLVTKHLNLAREQQAQDGGAEKKDAVEEAEVEFDDMDDKEEIAKQEQIVRERIRAEKEAKERWIEEQNTRYLDNLMRIYTSVGRPFLIRLLKTPKTQGLALNILSTFVANSAIAGEFQENAAEIFDVIVKPGSLSQETIVADAVTTLTHVLGAGEEKIVGIPKRGFSVLVDVLARAPQSLHQSLVCLLNVLLAKAVDICPLEASDVQHALTPLCKLFREKDTSAKVEVLKTLFFLLAGSYPRQPDLGKEGEWCSDLREGIQDVITSRVSDEERRMCLVLVSVMLHTYGHAWASKPAFGKKKGHFVQILMNVVCVEVRVLLMVMGGPHPDQSLTQTIIACFTIIELSLNFLCAPVQDEYSWSNLEGLNHSSLNFLRAALHPLDNNSHAPLNAKRTPPTTIAIGSIILMFQARYNEIFGEILLFLKEMEEKGRTNDALVVASIRAVGAWMAEETEALQDQFLDVLPFMLKVTAVDNSSPDPLVFLSASLVSLLQENELVIAWCHRASCTQRWATQNL